MWVLALTALLVYGSVRTAHSAIPNHRGTEGGDTALSCENNGKVIWSKGVDGRRENILTAQHGKAPIKHKPDPDDRYTVLRDLLLVIKDLSLSDSGIYYCNSVPVVSLTVTPLQTIYNQRGTEGGNTALYCENDGKVIWTKGVDGGRGDILTAQHGEVPIKHKPDPDDRYTVLSDSSLMIKDLSLSDSGIYYCNAVPVVSLTVTPLQSRTAKTEKVSPGKGSTAETEVDSTAKGITTARATMEKDSASGEKNEEDDDNGDDDDDETPWWSVAAAVGVSSLVVLLLVLSIWRFFTKRRTHLQNQVQVYDSVNNLPAAPQPGFSVTHVYDSINNLPEAPQCGDQQRESEVVYFLAQNPTSNTTGNQERENEAVYFLATDPTSNSADQDQVGQLYAKIKPKNKT
ncbi:uncharacterized protein LOC117598183 isoform X2 [Pangasianodon hypophthalmus]|uniref:uncharacterized protein LOC117598183 isoform X2 n=1 Tax=Pangasianodon hypophthalmus TaxID=310915 RepID=UPI0023071F96|nr:uncharacterized protein LOC117598183 isoform X2 [Pangasianodon hypophthalmus]